ncbi:MAG: ABC transporter permease [Pirellulales bacterium]
MVIETEILPFWQWLLYGGSDDAFGALPWFFIAMITAGVVALLGGYLISAVRHGPIEGGDRTYRVVVGGLKNLLVLSPRRVYALARLTVQESLRRHVLVTLAVFLLILMFAALFLRIDQPDPFKLYVSFVLTATTYLVLLMALFLSVFSLPNDIKNRTIYTVVTKPVRPGEIVLGRMLGFAFVGTAVLAVMGLASYVFVVREIGHTHAIAAQTLQDAEGGGQKGRTETANAHRHDVTIDREGYGRTDSVQGHWHEVTQTGSREDAQYDVGPPQGVFLARVPVLGKLRFIDRLGEDKPRGISVGNEWGYRSYIEGGTQAAAIWTFDEVTPGRFEDGYLPIELTIRVFRTHKGDQDSIDRGILGSIVLRNPQTGLQSEMQSFRAREYYVDQQYVSRKLLDSDGNPIDLFDDLTHNGQLEVWVQCLKDEQYFGMAQADCYLRPRNQSFTVNFFKGFSSIWVQMLVVVAFGVMCSTFLSGPVAMMFTVAILVMGLFKDFMLRIATGDVYGGGPIESLIRIVGQQNLMSELNTGDVTTTVIRTADAVITFPMWVVASILPDFRGLSKVRWVSEGFDISPSLLAQDVSVSLAYLVGLFVVGYFFLRTREVAK